MMFRDVKVGDNLYVYDRSAISLRVDKVVNVSAPKLDKTNMAAGMVVDVSIADVTYTFRDASEIGFAGNLVISTDKSSILREVEGQKSNNESQIARVDQLKAELPKLDSVIDQLSPERKEKKVQEERMAKLEDSIGKLSELVEQMLKKRNNG